MSQPIVADCYYCVHYYARTFQGGQRAVRLDACRLASKILRRHPGKGVAETCPDYRLLAVLSDDERAENYLQHGIVW